MKKSLYYITLCLIIIYVFYYFIGANNSIEFKNNSVKYFSFVLLSLSTPILTLITAYYLTKKIRITVEVKICIWLFAFFISIQSLRVYLGVLFLFDQKKWETEKEIVLKNDSLYSKQLIQKQEGRFIFYNKNMRTINVDNFLLLFWEVKIVENN